VITLIYLLNKVNNGLKNIKIENETVDQK